MNVLLIDVDSLMPRPPSMANLALMKISADHRRRGDKVYLNRGCIPEKVHVSCVFRRNRKFALGIAKMFNCPVEVGGYGVNDQQLPYHIEHRFPHYDLYGINYSMGYTSRGCIRKCPWCIIPEKEGNITDHAPIDEFYDLKHGKLILLDNNFLASPKWHENLREIIARKIKVNFTQGLDIRLVDQEAASLLAKARSYNWRFDTQSLHFAFDYVKLESEVLEGIDKLKRAGVKPEKIMFFMLCGYGIKREDYTPDYFREHDYYRFKVLRREGVRPYVMVYNDRRDIPVLRHFQRWTIMKLYQRFSWNEYDHGDSQKWIRKGFKPFF